MAARNGSVHCVQLIIGTARDLSEGGAEGLCEFVGRPGGSGGGMALHYATMYGHFEVVKLLSG